MPEAIYIDMPLIEKYAREGASNREIAAITGCSEATLRRHCPKLMAKARAVRRAELRRLQWKAAQEGNAAMLIWLGKNELDQTDKQTHEHVGGVEFTLNIGQDLRPTGNNGSSRVTQN